MNNSLKDKFLYYCAPESDDDYFNNSLIYLCANDNKGSYGLIINRTCLLYTSDAADEGLGVDLGGRRII